MFEQGYQGPGGVLRGRCCTTDDGDAVGAQVPSCGKSALAGLGPDPGDPVLKSVHLTNQVIIALAHGGETEARGSQDRKPCCFPARAQQNLDHRMERPLVGRIELVP